VPQYALMDTRTGEIVRVVDLLVTTPPPGLICVPMPEISGAGDSSWRLAAQQAPPPRHGAASAEPPVRHAFSGHPQAQAILARLAAATADQQFSLLVFEIQETERGRTEPIVQASLRVLASVLGADDGVGALSDRAIAVVLDHADAGGAQAVSARLQRHLSQMPGGWTARCLAYPADRTEIDRLRARP
jgi:hypothetical protein